MDLLAIVLIVLAVFLGVRSGALPRLLGLAGAAIAALTGLAILPAVTPFLDSLAPAIRAIVVLSVLLGLIGLGEDWGRPRGVPRHRPSARAVGRVRSGDGRARRGRAGDPDPLAGRRCHRVGPVPPTLSQMAQTSTALRVVDAFFPPPTEIVLELGEILDDSGLPNVFIGLEQLPAPDIDLPPDALAPRHRATSGTLGPAGHRGRLRAACERILVRGRAGIPRDQCPRRGRRAERAGPDLERLVRRDARAHRHRARRRAALRRRPEVAPLTFTGEGPSRGALGATVGYPGGGNATVEPATVAAAYLATGLDVTGKARVTRRSSSSGRRSAGRQRRPARPRGRHGRRVVFAESRVDPDVGYALSPGTVVERISSAVGRCRRFR